MALDICTGKDPFFSSYSEVEMRYHLEKCFDSKHLTSFPGDSLRSTGSRLKKRVCTVIDVELFCVCRYPDIELTSRFGDMACCDSCQMWFHSRCMSIPKSVFTKSDVKWMCAKCK